MNNNPEGTPNPLNPNPTPVGSVKTPGVSPVASQPVAQPAPQQVTTTMGQPAPQQVPVVEQPVAQPTPVVAQPITASFEEALVEEQTVVPAPTEEPVNSVAPPEKKKKTSLIAIIIVFVVALVGCAVATIVMLDPFGFNKPKEDDRVPKALAALFSDGAPTNIGMDGVVTLYSYVEDSPVTSLDVAFSSKTNTESNAGTAEAVVTANFSNGTHLKFDADEIRTENGDLYLKLSGIPDAVTNYKKQLTEVDCETSDTTSCESNSVVVDQYITTLQSLGVIDVIDGEWILIPSTSFSNISDLTQVGNSSSQCLIDAVGTIGEYTDDLVNAYNTNQFITYSTQDLALTKKLNNLYRLGVDNEAFTGFINAMDTSGFVNELGACLGKTATNTTVSSEDLTDIVDALPTIYVEIDENNHFTRVYLKATSEDGDMEAIADIDLSYPTEFTIEEPKQYVDINTVLSKVLTTFYSGVIPQDSINNEE